MSSSGRYAPLERGADVPIRSALGAARRRTGAWSLTLTPTLRVFVSGGSSPHVGQR